MNNEDWIAYLGKLPRDLAEFGRAIMRRVDRLLNKDRVVYLESVQRIERAIMDVKLRLREVEDDQARYVGQQDRLEDRVEETERQVDALARSVAELHRERTHGKTGG